MPTKFVDPVTMRMWAALDRRKLVKAEALAAWLAEEYDIDISTGLIRRYKSGTAHTPAGLLPLLVEYSGRRDLVFGPYEREIGDHHRPNLVDADTVSVSLDRVEAAIAEVRGHLDGAGALPVREVG